MNTFSDYEGIETEMDEIDVNPSSIVEEVQLILDEGKFMLHISFQLLILLFFILLIINAVSIVTIFLNFGLLF